MMKKLSAGLILTDCSRFLVCHVTGRNFYDIPKGLVSAGEEPLQACIREVEEETGLFLGKEQLTDLGVFTYTREKNLHLFLLKCKELPDTGVLKCSSFFLDKNGLKIPEVNGYKHVSFAEKHLYLVKSMAFVIERVQGLPEFAGHCT